MKQLWNPGDDLCAEYSLPGEYCPEGGKNAGIILFQKITFRSQAERFLLYIRHQKRWSEAESWHLEILSGSKQMPPVQTYFSCGYP